MSLDWVVIFLILHSLLKVCSSDASPPQGDEATGAKSDILQKIEGNIQVKNAPSEDWMTSTKVCLDGGEYCGFLKPSGDFVLHNIPPGSYLVEVFSPNYAFESVRVDISSKNGKIRAREVNVLKSSAVVQVKYPLQFRAEEQAKFFERRESWSILGTLKNPMVTNHLAVTLPMYAVTCTGTVPGSTTTTYDGSAKTNERPRPRITKGKLTTS